MLFAIDWDVGGNVLGFIIGVIIRLYDLVASLIALIFAIASTDIFKEEMIKEITSRVYIVLAVFMLFRITISCIQFLVSPDKMDDKEAGFGAIIKRTAISVSLLALVPTIFAFAKDAQNYIISEIPTIILGKNLTGGYDLSKFKGQEGLAYEIGYNTFVSFLEYKSGEGCNDGSVAGLNGVTREQAQNSGANVIITDLESAHEWRFYLAGEKSASKEDNKNCKMPDKKGALKGTSKFKFNTILALLGGLFLVYCLVCMVIDVGIRCLKWAVLQIVAPIPIATYIDPKTSKKSFDAWKKNCFDVYCSLFINLIIIYLILWVFQKALLNSTFFESDPEMGAYGVLVKVALIIALFFFAKQAPKFLCDILGIKEGSGSFKEMLGRGNSALGIGAAGLSAFRGNYRNQNHGKNFAGDTVGQRLKHGLASKEAWGNRLKGLASGLAGATSANASAIKHIAKGESKGMRETMRYGRDHAMQARVNRTMDKLNGLSGASGWAQRHEAKLDQTYQIKTDTELAEFKLKTNDEIHKDVGDYKKAELGRYEKGANDISITHSGCKKTMSRLNDVLLENYDQITKSCDSGSYLYQVAQAAKNGTLDQMKISYSDLNALGSEADKAGVGRVASVLNPNGAITELAQKELFIAGMSGQIRANDGSSFKDANAYHYVQSEDDRKQFVNTIQSNGASVSLKGNGCSKTVANVSSTIEASMTELGNAYSAGTLTPFCQNIVTDPNAIANMTYADLEHFRTDILATGDTALINKMSGLIGDPTKDLSSSSIGSTCINEISCAVQNCEEGQGICATLNVNHSVLGTLVENGEAHVDVKRAVSAIKQTITTHAADLSNDISYKGSDGNMHPLSSPESYLEAFRDNFSGLDDAVQGKSAEIQTKLSSEQSKRQAANESLKRRQANKDKK